MEEEHKQIFMQQEMTKVKIATEMMLINENLNKKSSELDNLKSKYDKLKSSYGKLERICTDLVVEISRLEEENKTLKDQKAPLKNREATHKEMTGKKNQDMAPIKEEKEHFFTRLQNFIFEHGKRKSDYAKPQEHFRSCIIEISRLEEENKILQYKITHLTNMESQNKDIIRKQNQEMAQIKDENEHLLNRLSTSVGERLAHDNVNIANLNDPFRPTKLSELYSELYDNEWTDAFQELTEALGFSEEKATGYLLNIIMNAYRKCKEITWDRYNTMKLVSSTLAVKHDFSSSRATTDSQETMKTTTLLFALSIDQERSLKNIWRATTRAFKDESLKLLETELKTSLGISETKMPNTCKYLTGCIDICFKMGFKETPMHLHITAEKETGSYRIFDTEKFRAYTKSGKYAAYVVWPALFLQEGGSMLVKGIAQGCQECDSNV
ncbi:hypothetical protein CHS0354_014230 [Potamilus streckersoni]|uniref:Mitochondria-eating protein C-terminal domain-containing protein n=1 Tax=Potamilus streckersoni TaxID=2493646 RepID=A0AAE0RXQ2_9BIVA|nr:hypothetical protein CHS0354_014230 [Potamilus streckersoni]